MQNANQTVVYSTFRSLLRPYDELPQSLARSLLSKGPYQEMAKASIPRRSRHQRNIRPLLRPDHHFPLRRPNTPRR